MLGELSLAKLAKNWFIFYFFIIYVFGLNMTFIMFIWKIN